MDEFNFKVANDDIIGVSGGEKFGANADVDTGSTPEDLWANGGVWVPPTAARIHACVSSAAADDEGSTGAEKIMIYGLDENWNQITEEVTLNGTSAVNTTNAFIRINRVIVTQSGSGNTNAGDITLTAATDSTVSAKLLAGKGKSLLGVYSTAKDENILIEDYYAKITRQSPSGANAEIELKVKENADLATSTWRTEHFSSVQITGADGGREFKNALKFGGKTDIKIQITTVSDDNTGLIGGFGYKLV